MVECGIPDDLNITISFITLVLLVQHLQWLFMLFLVLLMHRLEMSSVDLLLRLVNHL